MLTKTVVNITKYRNLKLFIIIVPPIFILIQKYDEAYLK